MIRCESANSWNRNVRRWRPSGASADPQSSSAAQKASESRSGYDHRRRSSSWASRVSFLAIRYQVRSHLVRTPDIEDMQPANHYQPDPPSSWVSASTSCASQHAGGERMSYRSKTSQRPHFLLRAPRASLLSRGSRSTRAASLWDSNPAKVSKILRESKLQGFADHQRQRGDQPNSNQNP